MSLNVKKFVNSALLDEKVIKGLGSLAGQIGYGAFSGDLNSGVGAGINKIGNDIGSVLPGKTGAIVSLGSGLVGGAINSLIGTKWNQLNIENVENETARMNNLEADANSLDALQDTIATTAGMSNFSDSYIGEGGLFAKGKVRDRANKLRDNLLLAFDRLNLTLDTNALNIMQDTIGNLEANYVAFGGPLYYADGGPIDKEEINPGLDAMVKARLALDSHFGNPTARRMTNYDTRSYIFTGLEKNIDGTLASPKGTKGNVYVGSWDNLVTPQIQDVDGELKFIEDPWSDENRERSKAQSMKFENPRDAEYFAKNYKRFAPMMSLYSRGGVIQNARKWHHSFGGELNTQGGNFTNGLLYINNGGSHEENPYEGVPMGVDNQGTPNLVEEGETVFNDYVFSKRLKVPKALRKKYKLRDNITFADASKKLSKESEERPNDPISQNGLEALMGELAYAQEDIREKKLAKNMYAYGGPMGNMFAGPGTNPNRLKHDNDGINFDYLYNKGSKYMTNRDHVLLNWDSPYVKKWRELFMRSINDYNKDFPGFTPYTMDTLTKDEYKRLSLDKRYGAVHLGTLNLDPSKNTIIRHMLRSTDNSPMTAMPEEAYYYPGYDPVTGLEWFKRWGDLYSIVNNGRALVSIDPETGANVLTYMYDPIEKKPEKTPGKVFFRDSKEGPWSAGELLSEANKRGVDWADYNSGYEDEEGNMYYTKLKPGKEMPNFDSPLRYAPVVGSLVGLGTSLFSKPDESGVEAILEASRGAGNYQPVRFRPVGNYLTYKPFDLDYSVNQANAESAAARRAILNTSGGNRAQAMAGILAADNNALNQLGALRRGAAEDNLKQRQLVEDFNRATNEFNSDGFLKADMANQSALAQARDFSLRGTMAAEEMRLRSRLAHDNAIQANLSGLFTSLGNIGQENVSRQLMKWMTDNGFVPGYGKTNEMAKGGKLKRKKKGLTY